MEQNSALMRGPGHGGARQPRPAAGLRELLIEPEMAEFRRVVQRAVDRGEVRADNPAIDYVMHMIIGAFVARTLIDEQPPTQAFLTSYIDAVVLPALGADPIPPSSP